MRPSLVVRKSLRIPCFPSDAIHFGDGEHFPVSTSKRFRYTERASLIKHPAKQPGEGTHMGEWTFVNEGWFAYLVLPALIFCARIVDVSLDTMRIIFLNRGRKITAPILGFFQALIWILAISQVMKNLANPVCYLSYGAGFGAGNLIGMLIEEKVAAGLLAVRIILARGTTALAGALRGQGYGVTVLDGHGSAGPVQVVFAVIRRRHLPQIVGEIKQHAPGAFYSIEEIRSTTGGTLAPLQPPRQARSILHGGGRI